MSSWIRFLLSLLLLMPAMRGVTEDVLSGPVAADVIDVVDGDTLTVRAQIWLGQQLETRVRLAGVDTPELRARCSQELALAGQATDAVAAMVAGRRVLLRNVHYGTYAGRVVAEVEVDGRDVATVLIESGLGAAYDGRGDRPDWCL